MLLGAEALLDKQGPINGYVYIAVGGKESEVMIRVAQTLADELRKKNFPDLQIDFKELPDEDHASILHQSINDAFRNLYPLKDYK